MKKWILVAVIVMILGISTYTSYLFLYPTPENSIRLHLLSHGFFIKAYIIKIKKLQPFRDYDPSRQDLKENEELYHVSPAPYERETGTYLETFSVTKKKNAYEAIYFGDL